MNLNNLSPAALSAAMETGIDNWGKVGDATQHKVYVQAMKQRAKCLCGCNRKRTHIAMANGVGLNWGCEMDCYRFAKEMNAERLAQ